MLEITHNISYHNKADAAMCGQLQEQSLEVGECSMRRRLALKGSIDDPSK